LWVTGRKRCYFVSYDPRVKVKLAVHQVERDDGLIGEDAVLEVKCPNTDNHIDNILFGSQIELYKYQLQGSLWVTGRKRCYFVSYDPRVKVKLAVHQVERDDDLIAEMQGRYLHFEAEIKKIQEML
jgi:predicted phage-related endonuclease